MADRIPSSIVLNCFPEKKIIQIPEQNRTKEDEIWGRQHFVIFFVDELTPSEIHFHSDSICTHVEISKTTYSLNSAMREKDKNSDTRYGFMLAHTFNFILKSNVKNQFIPN